MRWYEVGEPSELMVLESSVAWLGGQGLRGLVPVSSLGLVVVLVRGASGVTLDWGSELVEKAGDFELVMEKSAISGAFAVSLRV